VVEASDPSGNTRTEMVHVSVDTLQPVLEITSPKPDSTTNQDPISLTGMTEANVIVKVNGEVVLRRVFAGEPKTWRETEIAVPAGPAGHFEPLFAVYRTSIVPEVETLLRSGERSIIPLFGRCRTVVLPIEKLSWLRNLNTRGDYESYLHSLANRRARVERKGRSGVLDGRQSLAPRREKGRPA
jgi:hypothetical protein